MPSSFRRSRPMRRSFPARTRRRTQWVDYAADTTALAVGHYENTDILSTYRPMPGAETTGITVLRVHLRLWITSSVVVGDGLITALIVDDQGEVNPNDTYAAHVSINPVTQPYIPWMMYQRQNAHPGYSFVSPNNQWEWDIRSKRKVPFGSTLIYHFGNFDASAAVSASLHVRTLIALS